MTIEVNNQPYTLPTTLFELTLKERIGFHNEHGALLQQMADSIKEITDPLERDLETMLFNVEGAYRIFSFFTGIGLEVVKQSELVEDILKMTYATMSVLFEQEQALQPQTAFIWNNEAWELAAPQLKQGDKLTFGELIDAKQMIQNMQQLSKSQWESLLPLCAIFFRKKGEPYDESFVYEDSERLQLMETLPLEYALQVGFFLSISLRSFTTTLPFFNKAGSEKPVSSAKNTLSAMDGSIS
jgi:hypothetical protein